MIAQELPVPPNKMFVWANSHLAAIPHRDASRVRRLISELDSSEFATRELAASELKRMGVLAEPELRQVLESQTSAEVRRQVALLLDSLDPDLTGSGRLEKVRAIQWLEYLGTKEARVVLAEVASGEPLAPLTRDAKAALEA